MPQIPIEEIHSVRVLNGMTDQVNTAVVQPIPSLLIRHGSSDSVKCSVELAENVEAPVEKGQRIGTVKWTQNDEVLYDCPILAEESVNKITFARAFLTLFHALLCSKI